MCQIQGNTACASSWWAVKWEGLAVPVHELSSLSFHCHPFSLFKNILSFQTIALSALPSFPLFSHLCCLWLIFFLFSLCPLSFIPAIQYSSSVTLNFHSHSSFSVRLRDLPLDADLSQWLQWSKLWSQLSPQHPRCPQHHGCRSLQVFKCPEKTALSEKVEEVVQKMHWGHLYASLTCPFCKSRCTFLFANHVAHLEVWASGLQGWAGSGWEQAVWAVGDESRSEMVTWWRGGSLRLA